MRLSQIFTFFFKIEYIVYHNKIRKVSSTAKYVGIHQQCKV